MFDSTAQICCGLPKPRNAVDGVVCDRMLRATNPGRRNAVRPRRGVTALRDRTVGDVGVGTDEVVGLDVAEHQVPVRAEAGADADLRRASTDRLERLLERQDEPDGSVRAEGHERDERLVLGVLLAAEPTARVGREHPDLGQRQVQETGHDPLQPVRVLDRAPDRDAVAVRGGHEPVGLDRELGDHRERVRAVDDDVRGCRLDVAPAVVMLAQDVRRRERIVGPERRVLDERRVRIEGRRHREDGRQLLVVDPNEGGRLLGGVPGLGGDRGDRLAVIVRLPDREDRPVLELRPEPWHRLGKIRGGDGETDARDGEGGTRVDRRRSVPGPRRGSRA